MPEVLVRLIAFVKKFYVPGINGEGRRLAAKEFEAMLTPATDASQAEGKVALPLGQILNWAPVTLKEDQIVEAAKDAYKRSPEFKAAKADMGMGADDEDPSVIAPPWKFVVTPLLSAYQGAAVHQLHWDRAQAAKLTLDDVGGKDGIGWIRTADSDPLDLNGLIWRMPDWLRPEVRVLTAKQGVAFETLSRTGDQLGKLKERMGDGITGVVTPEVAGKPAGYIGEIQSRSLLRAPDGTIVTLYKGIVVVHPDADNTWAFPDGYGSDPLSEAVRAKYGIGENGEGLTLHLYEMLDGEGFVPRCRYTIQGLYYNGRTGWERIVFALENLKLANSERSILIEDRMLRANVPIKALGGWGVMTALTRLLKLTVASGHARLALAGDAFQFIRGMEYVHEALGKSYTSRVTGQQISGFYAPESLRSYFEAAGGVGTEWALNRRPDLPANKCVHRHVLLGYVPMNAFVVNGTSMKLSGLDFDGDMICVFPTVERSGLYQCFNDLDLEEQARRAANGSRKDQEKKDFANGGERHASQLVSVAILGMADVTARKFYDLRQPDIAWTMEPWIQASVDLQKRDVALPDSRGAMFMPSAIVPDDAVTATELLRALQKGPRKDDELTAVERASFVENWKSFQYKLDVLFRMSQLGQDSDVRLLAPTDDMKHCLPRFGYELGTRVARAVGELDMYVNAKSDQPMPLMRKLDYPDREVPSFKDAPEDIRKLVQTVQIIDLYSDELTELRKAVPAIKQGYFNLKDGMVDAARSRGVLGQIARYASRYPTFLEFAQDADLVDYFRDVPGLRLSDLFSVIEGTTFPRVEGISVPTYRNDQPVFIGLHQYDAGDVTVSRVRGSRELVVTAKHREFAGAFRPGAKIGVKFRDRQGRAVLKARSKGTVRFTTQASTVQDALLGLREYAAARLLEQGSMLHPLQVVERQLRAEIEREEARPDTSHLSAAEQMKASFGSAFGPAQECSWDDLGAQPEPQPEDSAADTELDLGAKKALVRELVDAWGPSIAQTSREEAVQGTAAASLMASLASF